MYYLRIYNKLVNKYFEETYYSEYLFNKRKNKLKYSKNLVLSSWGYLWHHKK